MEVEADLAINVIIAFAFVFIGYYVTRALDRRHLPKIEAARQEAITGTWKGVSRQDKNKNREACEFPVELVLKAGPRLVTGTMVVTDGMRYEFDVEGTFEYHKYLKLSYAAAGKTASAFDFGTLFLELDDCAAEISGSYAGYGSASKFLVSGQLSLQRSS